MRVFTKLASAAVLCASLGSVQAATVDCPGVLGANQNRQVSVTAALALNAGGSCYFQEGNLQNQDVFNWLGTYTLIDKDEDPGNEGGEGGLRYTTTNAGRTTGTWAMGDNFWDDYNEIFIGFHFGNGSGNPDSFIVELDPGNRSAGTNGTWALLPAANANALSNISLFGRGRPAANGGGPANGGGNVPEPATLALVGLGLLGTAAARRRRV